MMRVQSTGDESCAALMIKRVKRSPKLDESGTGTLVVTGGHKYKGIAPKGIAQFEGGLGPSQSREERAWSPRRRRE